MTPRGFLRAIFVAPVPLILGCGGSTSGSGKSPATTAGDAAVVGNGGATPGSGGTVDNYGSGGAVVGSAGTGGCFSPPAVQNDAKCPADFLRFGNGPLAPNVDCLDPGLTCTRWQDTSWNYCDQPPRAVTYTCCDGVWVETDVTGGHCPIPADGGAPDAGSVSCWGDARSFPSFDRRCTTSQDCVVIEHQTDCCGSMDITAISASEKAGFDAAEKICRSEYPACGCPPGIPTLDDGTTGFGSITTDVVAQCESGQCRSAFNGATFPCSTKVCTSAQACLVTAGGIPNPPAYACVPDSSCAAGCSGCTTFPGCTCEEGQGGGGGYVIITCPHG